MLIEDNQNKALEEIKRADHQVHVTLKYTRTADVIRNIIERLINAYDYIFLEYLTYLKDKGKLKEIPASNKARMELFKNEFKGKAKIYLDLYVLMKNIHNAEFGKKEEFRKHVTLIAHLNKKIVNVDIPVITDYYYKAREFFALIQQSMKWLTLF